MNLSLFGITYAEWTQICQMYFSLKKGIKQSYLQFFPFSKLTTSNIKRIKSEDFFLKYINNGCFLFNDTASIVTDNYILKADNSFRDAKLISMFLFLILQTIGFSISNKYKNKRPKEISTYYAGNYKESKVYYKKEYNKFFKEINSELVNYSFFIKTDIRNFFHSINLNKLIDMIDINCNESKKQIVPVQLYTLKMFFDFCGNGYFPCNENSVAASFLATLVYLEKSDIQLYNYLEEKTHIKHFKMIRYVDDLYILLNVDFEKITKENLYNDISEYYSSLLKDFDLSLNHEKCGIYEITKINEVLKQSLYDEYFNNIKFKISSFYNDDINTLLDYFITCAKSNTLTNIEYRKSINNYLTHSDIEFSALEIFNYFVYNSDSFSVIPNSLKKVTDFFNINLEVLKIDPKRLTILLLKTNNERLIKKFLNYEFSKYRNKDWNKYDSAVVINYLIQRNFKHTDIKKCLVNESKEIEKYINYYCEQSFLTILNNPVLDKISEILNKDWKSCFMYFMFMVEMQHKNYLTSFAYYKTYFDRVTAFLDNSKEPNYQKYFREDNHKKFYSKIENSETILKNAFKMRNDNPISHAEAKLINEHYTTEKILIMIQELNTLLHTYIARYVI